MEDIYILEQSYKNPAKFTEIFNRYNKSFLKRAKIYLRSQNSTEDAVQNAFIKIYKYGKQFVLTGGDFKSWAYTILKNCINDELRKQIENAIPISDKLASVVTAEDDSEVRLNSDYLHSVIDKLSKDSADILKLHYIDGKPQKQIAKILGLSHSAVRVKIFRAKQDCIKIHKKIYNE